MTNIRPQCNPYISCRFNPSERTHDASASAFPCDWTVTHLMAQVDTVRQLVKGLQC